MLGLRDSGLVVAHEFYRNIGEAAQCRRTQPNGNAGLCCWLLVGAARTCSRCVSLG